jgi:hypothetical protein
MNETRTLALDAACRISREGESTSGVLSRASQIETYLTSGLIRTGPQWESGVEVGVEGVSVIVHGKQELTADVVKRLRVAVAGVL